MNTAFNSAQTAVDNNFLLTTFVIVNGAMVAYQAYEVFQTFKNEGAVEGLKKLGLEVATSVAGGVVFKAGGKLIAESGAGKTVVKALNEALETVLNKSPALKFALNKFVGKLESFTKTLGDKLEKKLLPINKPTLAGAPTTGALKTKAPTTAQAKVSGVKASTTAETGTSTVHPSQNPKNVAHHERYRDILIQNMETPHVTDPELKKIVSKLYRPNAKVGSGSTADALRSELKTGQPVGGKFHKDKSVERIRNLKRWINAHTTNANRPISEIAKRTESTLPSAQDMQTAKNLLRDLERALNGH